MHNRSLCTCMYCTTNIIYTHIYTMDSIQVYKSKSFEGLINIIPTDMCYYCLLLLLLPMKRDRVLYPDWVRRLWRFLRQLPTVASWEWNHYVNYQPMRVVNYNWIRAWAYAIITYIIYYSGVLVSTPEEYISILLYLCANMCKHTESSATTEIGLAERWSGGLVVRAAVDFRRRWYRWWLITFMYLYSHNTLYIT